MNYPLTEFGQAGERWVAQKLRSLGYAVEMIGNNADYDLLLDGRARVEVKSAFSTLGSKGNKKRWQFSLRRRGKLVDEDLLFLLCYDDIDSDLMGVFVIPGEALSETLTKIDITSEPGKYGGKWGEWLENYAVIDEVLEYCAPNPKLFRGEVEEEIPF